MADIQVIWGSISDKEIGEKTTNAPEKLGIKYGITVASAHGAPERVVKNCERKPSEGVHSGRQFGCSSPGSGCGKHE
jgi:phosphoribosylcarboxyaminoimidazole (NCAIR) mutase